MANVQGIDVSKHNGTVDFAKVKAAGKSFVLLRAGYGKLTSQKDAMFETNYKNAKAAGLHVGAYWYSYATSASEAEAEAKACLECIKGKQFEYPVLYDVEEECTLKLGKATVSSIIKTFCSYLEKQGYFVGLYMSRSDLVSYTTDEVQKAYALWIAEWASKCNYSGGGTIGIWQSSEKGSVSGCSGNVDLDTAYVDYPTTIQKGGYNGFSKSAATSASSTSTTAAASTAKSYAKGTKITLKNATLYASATASSGTKKSGTYYIYDGTVTNGRMRITNSSANVGKTPVGSYVTGWVKQSEMQ